MIYGESNIVSRVKISGDVQLKNLATLSQLGYEIYFIESAINRESGDGVEPYFYYEALRNNETLRAETPVALLQLVNDAAEK